MQPSYTAQSHPERTEPTPEHAAQCARGSEAPRCTEGTRQSRAHGADSVGGGASPNNQRPRNGRMQTCGHWGWSHSLTARARLSPYTGVCAVCKSPSRLGHLRGQGSQGQLCTTGTRVHTHCLPAPQLGSSTLLKRSVPSSCPLAPPSAHMGVPAPYTDPRPMPGCPDHTCPELPTLRSQQPPPAGCCFSSRDPPSIAQLSPFLVS